MLFDADGSVQWTRMFYQITKVAIPKFLHTLCPGGYMPSSKWYISSGTKSMQERHNSRFDNLVKTFVLGYNYAEGNIKFAEICVRAST